MSGSIERLKPVRWKVFQCLLIEGENAGEDAMRNAERLVISDQEFQDFIDRHRANKMVKEILVPESNKKMKDSYLILNEYLQFLNCTTGAKVPGPSIRDVSVVSALRTAGFDEKMFYDRLGEYEWSKDKVLRKPKRSYMAYSTGLVAVFSLALCGAAFAAIAEAGAVPHLAALLKDPKAQVTAAGALRNLAAQNVANQEAICRDALQSLVQLVTDGKPKAQVEAAGAIHNLAAGNAKSQQLIVEAGALEPLVALLKEEAPRVREVAAGALWALARDNPELQSAIDRSGAIQPPSKKMEP
eukprot:s1365_g24.t1